MSSDRESALLTPTQRAFLSGETDFSADDPRGRTLRTRMRSRLHPGLQDFALLADPDRFDDTDLELLREQMVEDDTLVSDLAELVAFVYRLDPDTFETVVETGVKRGVSRSTSDYTVGEVKIPILKRGHRLEEIRARMDTGEPLTDRQVRILLEHGEQDPQEIRDYVKSHPSPETGRSDRRRFR